MVVAERLKRDAGRTSQNQKSNLYDSDDGIQDMDASKHKGNGFSPTETKVKGSKKREMYAEGHDSCEEAEEECNIVSNDGAFESETKIEAKSEEESSDEGETLLRKWNTKTATKRYANNMSDEVEEASCNSDVDVTQQKVKVSKKTKVYSGKGLDSCEGFTKECHIFSNDDAPESKTEIEEKLEESSDEETASLRKLNAKTTGKNYANNTLNEVQEMSRNSNVDVTKSKKRQIYAEEITEGVDYEGSHKKRIKTNLQNEVVSEPKGADTDQMTRLSLTTGFVWDANPSLLPAATAAHKSDTSSDEEEVHKHEGKRKKLTRAERRERARKEEEHLRAVEQKLMDSEIGPQSADDFDRLVLSSPNSSLCWIKYMAFHLQATEIEKARAVAQRGLSTISFREEQEKLNVWCALLNLENLYGSKESLDRILEEAVRMNDPFRVYTQMLQIYADSGKTEEAEKLVSLLTRKFRDNKEAWLLVGEVLLKLGKLEKSRSLMQKALTSLDKKLHVEVISKFAHLENRLGEPERAQTLMEHILTSYPKRVDIWNSYVDMLVKNGQLEAARQVLERGVAQKLPARKMKSLFAKFLQFEEQHGTPEGVEKVRQMAISYVEATAGRAEEDID